MRVRARQIARNLLPLGLLALIARGRAAHQAVGGAALAATWAVAHARYRSWARAETRADFARLAPLTRDAYRRHYNERVPTVLEERGTFVAELYFQRHLRRYRLVAGLVRAATTPDRATSQVRLLDLGCGGALLAGELDDPIDYVALDYTGHHTSAARRHLERIGRPPTVVRGEAESLPFRDRSFDVVVMSEVIEHLMRPEDAMWEVSRVLRKGGTLVITTDNASEMPARSILSHPLQWLEHALSTDYPRLLSFRAWAWPQPIDAELHPDTPGPLFVPHTHHLRRELETMADRAGLAVTRWFSFEFFGHQTAVAQALVRLGERGLRLDSLVERVVRRIPVIRRMGVRQALVATKRTEALHRQPVADAWHGPWSEVPQP